MLTLEIPHTYKYTKEIARATSLNNALEIKKALGDDTHCIKYKLPEIYYDSSDDPCDYKSDGSYVIYKKGKANRYIDVIWVADLSRLNDIVTATTGCRLSNRDSQPPDGSIPIYVNDQLVCYAIGYDRVVNLCKALHGEIRQPLNRRRNKCIFM